MYIIRRGELFMDNIKSNLKKIVVYKSKTGFTERYAH